MDIVETLASPLIVVLCFCIGEIVKKTANSEAVNRYIPLIVGGSGVAASILVNVGTGIEAGDVVQIVTVGLVSGLASTGVYELGKNLKGGGDAE